MRFELVLPSLIGIFSCNAIKFVKFWHLCGLKYMVMLWALSSPMTILVLGSDWEVSHLFSHLQIMKISFFSWVQNRSWDVHVIRGQSEDSSIVESHPRCVICWSWELCSYFGLIVQPCHNMCIWVSISNHVTHHSYIGVQSTRVATLTLHMIIDEWKTL